MLGAQPRVADALSGGNLQNIRNRLIKRLDLKKNKVTENVCEQQYDIKV